MDADDIKLVEMLANLAEESEMATNDVDNDSVLGSQYSMFSEPAQNVPQADEEEEVEDLNITSLDLENISSWDVTHKSSNQCTDAAKDNYIGDNRLSSDGTNVTEENCEDVTLINLPQLDGVDDLCINVSDREEEIVGRLNNMACCTAVSHSSKNIKHNSCTKFTIPSVDGATVSDSSNSEPEVDVTIDRQEELTCVYKSGKKGTPRGTVQITPKKRKLNDDDALESPNKRKNTKTPKKQFYNSPNKVYKSPSWKYTPLDITITSPKTSRNPIGQRESPKKKQYMLISDIPSTSTAPKCKTQILRTSLLREKRTSLLNSDSGDLSHGK